MAKLSAHGKEIGRIEGLTRTRAYFSDGKILRNDGFGWKLFAKFKPDVDPVEGFARAKAAFETKLKDNPAAAEYRRQLHDLACVSKRWKLHAAVTMMPDDPDGVWSEACDGYGDNISADLDEIVSLCRAYKVAHMTA